MGLQVGANTVEDNIAGPQKTKTELLYDPTISLIGIYLNKTIIQRDTWTPMFIALLFMIAKTWKEPKCPSTDKWIKKIGTYIYN